MILGLGLALFWFIQSSRDQPDPVPPPLLSQGSPFDQLDLPDQQDPNIPYEQFLDPWLGRLILPTETEIQERIPEASTEDVITEDWVQIQIDHAPDPQSNWTGEVVRLTWAADPEIQAYVRNVSQDVQFIEAVRESQQEGLIHPDRLNGRSKVGPLESLSGSRPQDDVRVQINPIHTLTDQADGLDLQITKEPIQTTGQLVTLVQILEPLAAAEVTSQDPQDLQDPQNLQGSQDLQLEDPSACKSDPSTCDQDLADCGEDLPSCVQEFYQAQFYNPATGEFDGPTIVIRIPQMPPGQRGVVPSTPNQIEQSAAGNDGWYLYGVKDRNDHFIVQAIEPRSLTRLQPDQVILGQTQGLEYIREQNWHDTENRKGTIQSVLVDPAAAQTPQQAISEWQEGDRALVVHLFGGIGGQKQEPKTLGIVTGHFAYGVADVVRDPFTQELRFKLTYEQVYAHNPKGIIAGSIRWPAYMGDLQRGWLGTRPVSDGIVKLAAITDNYTFGEIMISPLQELQHQLQIMAARYRIGDGTGIAAATPATSCVQDANQALYATIKKIQQQVQTTPSIQQWLQDHPEDPQTQRFQELAALGADLEAQLVPLGIVRKDWQQNLQTLAGIGPDRGFVQDSNLMSALLSWRTLLPRRAHDEILEILLDHGAKIWFLRTNQVGGWDPTIMPLAPTVLIRG